MRKLRGRLAVQDGWALVTALMLMTMMMGSGLAVASYLDNEGNQTRIGRNRETAFNLAEGALNAQVYALARAWPGQGAATRPSAQFYSAASPCSSAVTAANAQRCPSATQLAGMFPTSDGTNATWTTSVRDHTAGQDFYTEAGTASSPGYDADGDGKVWVVASGTARGKTRTLVALARAEQQYEDIPRAAVVTGRLSFENNGNQTKVATGTSTLGVVVRCVHALNEPSACLGYDLDAAPISGSETKFQDALSDAISPKTINESPTFPAVMSPEALERMKNTAWQNNTYYTSCPSSYAGAVVVVDVHAACPAQSGTVTVNSAQKPGMVIFLNSDSSFSALGHWTFYGVFYHANLPAPGGTGDLVSLSGNAAVYGGVMIDGVTGGLSVQGSAKISFDANAFNAVQSTGSAGIVRDSWREMSKR